MSMLDSLRERWGFHATVAATISLGTFFLYRLLIRRNKIDKKMKNEKKDVVYLHMFPRSCAKQVSNLSPFAMKLETWLRMKKIPHEVVETIRFSKKGQIPYIRYNGEEIADSFFIIKFLTEKLNLDATDGLSLEQQGVSRAFISMVEYCTSWTCFLYRYSYMPDIFAKYYRPPAPYLIQKLIVFNLKRYLKKRAHAHGIGRHSPEEVGLIGTEDLRAVSGYLGNKPFIMGDEPTTVDCALFGILTHIVYVGFPYPHKKVLETECTNIRPYLDRMKERFWPDWDKLVDNETFH